MRRSVAAVVLLLVVVGGACSRSEDRPEGIVERWLQAVSDQGRDNLADDAADRAAGYQRVESGVAAGLGDRVVAGLVPAPSQRPDDERLFEDLEVGRADVDGDRARVPFRVTRQLDDDDEDELTGTVLLIADGDTWEVAELDVRRPGERVPSEGGERPARASAAQWAVAGAIGLAFTVVMVLVIEAQPRPEPPEGSAGAAVGRDDAE